MIPVSKEKLGKTVLDKYVKAGDRPNSKNTYYQEKRWGIVKKKRLIFSQGEEHDGVTDNDREILRKVCHRAYWFDQHFRICCSSVRFGWSAILGLIPVVGDALEILLSLYLIKKASKIEGGLPAEVYSKMFFFIMVDFALGFFPIIGDILDVGYRANTRNAWLLETYLLTKGEENLKKKQVAGGTQSAVPLGLTAGQEDRDIEQGVEPTWKVPAVPATPAAVLPAPMKAHQAKTPPPGRNLTGRQARDPRDRK